MGPMALFSSEERQICIYLKNPSLTAGFEPANFGYNGKHANHYFTEDNKVVISRTMRWRVHVATLYIWEIA
jgi:hypothetical protein